MIPASARVSCLLPISIVPWVQYPVLISFSMKTHPETWILYKATSGSAPGWETRKLLPSGGLTDILSEEWDWTGGPLPQVGDRLQAYTNLEDLGNGITHGRDGDWVVSNVQTFTSPDTDTQIVVCLCEYAPIAPTWEPLSRGEPIPADLTTPAAIP